VEQSIALSTTGLAACGAAQNCRMNCCKSRATSNKPCCCFVVLFALLALLVKHTTHTTQFKVLPHAFCHSALFLCSLKLGVAAEESMMMKGQLLLLFLLSASQVLMSRHLSDCLDAH
jgi:hypothetical protein